MIFLDTNIFLRYLEGATTEFDKPRVEQATELFHRIRRGDIEVTTSEVVIHEVCFVLHSPRQYGRTVAEIVDVLSGILAWPGFQGLGDDLVIIQRAFELWLQQPSLGFADAVIAARCEHGGFELASFDGHFDRIPSLSRWQPAPVTPGES